MHQTITIMQVDWNDRETHGLFIEGDSSPISTGTEEFIEQQAVDVASGRETFNLEWARPVLIRYR